MQTIHDSGYKKLFSNRVIFRQLIETFVHEPWVGEIDFEKAETLDKSFISDHYKETESDLIYKVTFRGRDVYLFVLLEFQSTVDPFMALRVLNYVVNFYMDYVQSQENAQTLPPVFPVVLYNGDRPWTAPVKFSDLLDDADLLGRYAPRFEYLKLAEREYPKETLIDIHNIVSTLFLAEAHYERELILEQCVNVFQHEEDRQAVSLLLNWFRQLTAHGRIDAADYSELEHVYQNVEEVRSMLVTALEREREQFRKEGRAEGRGEGLLQGAQQALKAVLESKFGDAGTRLSQEIFDIHDINALQDMLVLASTQDTLEPVNDMIGAYRDSHKN